MPLKALVTTPLTVATVTGLTRSYVPTRFNVLNLCLRSSQDTYARTPTTSIYTSYLAHRRLFFFI